MHPDGSIDTSFRQLVHYLVSPHCPTGANGQLYVTGWLHERAQAWRFQSWHSVVIRCAADGTIDPSWAVSAFFDTSVWGFSVDPESNVLVHGRYQEISGIAVPMRGLVRLESGATTNLDWHNTSARGLVTPTDPLIVGFVVGGDAPQRLLVRGVGQSLARFGIENPLAAPRLQVFRGSELLLENSHSYSIPGLAEATQAAGAFPLDYVADEAAGLIVVPPGICTMVVSSEDGGSGTALGEVYALDVR